MKSQGRSRRANESGFAMLLVFVMAATIAITLFIEVPRIAFESQRTREQMTIDRALQYQRGIQLFYRKYKLYPQTLDDLETTRNIRFLRRRYKDPLTGKEYRLLHVGPSGQLTDSLIQPAPPLPGSSTGSGPNANSSSIQGPGQPAGSAQSLGASGSNSASNSNQPADPNNPNAQAPDPLNMALRRPSDRIAPTSPATGGQPGDPDSNPPPDQSQQPQDPSQSGQQPAQPGQPTVPGQPGASPQPGQPVIPGQPGQPGVGLPGIPGMPVVQPTFPSQPGQPQSPGQPPYSYPGQQPSATAGGAGAQGGNQAASMIQQLLTTPRQPPTSSPFTSGNTGGIAGVASTAEGKGIHIVNDHAKYKEWEFVYDIKKDKTVVGAAGVAQQQQVQQQMQQSQQPNSAFGGNSTFGNNSPGGNNTTGNSPFSSSSTSSGAASSTPTTPPPQ